MSDLPTYDQIVQLPTADDQAVPQEFIDLNGHMNIRHYFDAASIALWNVCIAAGIDQAYSEQRGLTLFTVEQHLRYFSELRVGERFTVHGRFLERSDRALHAMSFIVAPDSGVLACTFEASYVHVDMGTRRAVEIPADVAALFDAEIANGDALGWDAPVCGSMGVRRR